MTEKLPSLNIATSVVEAAYQDGIKRIFKEGYEDVYEQISEDIVKIDLQKRFEALLKARRLVDMALADLHKNSPK